MGTEYVTSEQDGVDAEESGDRQTWLQLICCALSQSLSYISESYEALLQGSRGTFGGELSDERTRLETEDRGGILVNISDADYGVYTWLYTNERMQDQTER
jgi:hypothetical protein